MAKKVSDSNATCGAIGASGSKELREERAVEQQRLRVGERDQETAQRDGAERTRLRAGVRQIDRGRGPLADAEIEQVGNADPADPLEPAGERAEGGGEAECGQRKLDHDRR